MIKNFTRIALMAGTIAMTTTAASAEDTHAILAGMDCAADEMFLDRTSGSEDNYGGALDPATPRANLADSPAIANYNTTIGATTNRQYDQGGNNRFFIDTIRNLRPAGKQATQAMLLIRMKSTGGQFDTDSLLFGDLRRHGDTSPGGTGLMQPSDFASAKADNMGATGWSQTGDIYHADLSTIMTRDGSRSLLDIINAGNDRSLDVLVQDDANVDFIKIATCVAP